MKNDASTLALTQISDLVFSRDFGEARRRARELWARLFASADADPVLRGWARFYDFKCSYELCDYRAAYDLVRLPPGVHFTMTATNVAWMYSVAAELAMHLGLPLEVVRWAERCLELRTGAEHTAARIQCLRTACLLLAELSRDDLNLRFSRELLDWHEQLEEPPLLLHGCQYLLAAGGALNGRDHSRLIATLPKLTALSADAFSSRALECIAAIQGAPWFESTMPEAMRRKRADLARLWAACGDAPELTRRIAGGLDPNLRDTSGRSVLHHAALLGQAPAVRVLLENGAEVDAQNIQRRTALALAADQGHAQVVALLLDAGADPNIAGIADQTPLHLAAWQGHVDCVRLLLSRGAATELRDRTGNTALTLTATEDQPLVVEVLVAAGSPLDGCTPLGHSPLMKAAMEGQTRVVETLLALGADTGLRDRHGLSARDWAEREGHAHVQRLLNEASPRSRRNGYATLRLA